MVAQSSPDAYLLSTPHTAGTVKLLDLLTNRYHLGIVRENAEGGLQVELPASARLYAGQRVRLAMAGDRPLISRTAMQRAFVTEVAPGMSDRQWVQLALVPETAVA